MTNFRSLQIVQNGEEIIPLIQTLTTQELAAGFVRLRVDYSSVNYKDALALKKNGGVIRHYPMTPGIDLAGEVLLSTDPEWPVGTQVIVTGFDLGVNAPGGYSEIQDVPSNWLVRLPKTLTTKQSMFFGTAGFTAALAVQALTKTLTDKTAAIAITGATGGVASIAIALLASLGYKNITAITRKTENTAWLQTVGAKTIVTPNEVLPEKPRPLGRQQFAGIIDTVGGPLLSQLLPLVQYQGVVALCGNAGGMKIETTVFPFILRAIQLIGIDSVAIPLSQRAAIWNFLGEHQTKLAAIPQQLITLDELLPLTEQLVAGTHQGRTILKLEVTK